MQRSMIKTSTALVSVEIRSAGCRIPSPSTRWPRRSAPILSYLRLTGSAPVEVGHAGPLQQGLTAMSCATAPDCPPGGHVQRLRAELCRATELNLRQQDGTLSLIASHVRIALANIGGRWTAQGLRTCAAPAAAPHS